MSEFQFGDPYVEYPERTTLGQNVFHGANEEDYLRLYYVSGTEATHFLEERHLHVGANVVFIAGHEERIYASGQHIEAKGELVVTHPEAPSDWRTARAEVFLPGIFARAAARIRGQEPLCSVNIVLDVPERRAA